MEDLDEIVHEFLVESRENLDQLDLDLVALEGTPGSRELLARVFRTIHTIKGTSGFLAFGRLERLTHVGENLLVELRDGRRAMDRGTTDVLLRMVDTVRVLLDAIEAGDGEAGVDDAPVVAALERVLDGTGRAAGPPAVCRPEPRTAPAADVVPSPHHAPAPPAPADPATVQTPARPELDVVRAGSDTVRVDVDLLDALMRQVGELVLARNSIGRLAEAAVADADLGRAAQRLDLIASELQEGVMKTRMQPLDHLWSKVPRMARDLATACGRQVRVEMSGGDIEVDRSLLEAVKDPLTHLVRNAIDHGIEDPALRVAAGKPALGVLTLRAHHSGGQVVLEVGDDGAGIDREAVAARAVRSGLRTAAEVAATSPADLLQLLFVPGFSTAATLTHVSGRGVGMDVVRTKVEEIGGSVDVESVPGRGTTWRLRIPLTLAIMPAVTVRCDGHTYAIPQASLLELVALDEESAGQRIEHVRSAAVYRLRGELVPLVDLRAALGRPARTGSRSVLVVVQAEATRFGLLVDSVCDAEEIVVKPLTTRLRSIGLYAGATFLGDGQVALILDVQGIARRSLRAEPVERERTAAPEEAGPADPRVPVLVVGIGDERRVAIPLSEVTRIERVAASVVERTGSREVMQYRGAIAPVVRLGAVLGAPEQDRDELVVVIHSSAGRSVAVVVSEIVDIVDADPGQGTLVLRDRVTELVDLAALVATVDPPSDRAPADRVLVEV